MWPNSQVLHLNHLASDHRPILMENETASLPSRQPPFRYLTAWQSHQAFESMLTGVWNPVDPIVRNITNFQATTTVWNTRSFGHIGRRKHILMARIRGIERVNEGSSMQQLHELENKLKSELNETLKQEEVLWFQRARTE
ncbi:hypothetical protein V6N13_064467 [Hibiscus sabdariffa]